MHAIIGFDFCIEMFNLVSHLFLPFLPSGFLHNPLSFPQVPVLFVETQILEAVLVGPAGCEQLLRISLNLPMVLPVIMVPISLPVLEFNCIVCHLRSMISASFSL